MKPYGTIMRAKSQNDKKNKGAYVRNAKKTARQEAKKQINDGLNETNYKSLYLCAKTDHNDTTKSI